ncbi:MAG: efflux RND transporter permease subunit, partial [Nitrospinae bacterium]|nr:efflux RND transporter permease subunit [Nitrospinota bacterium]
RKGVNAIDVIDGVKAKLAALKAGLPEGVEIETVYDRSSLIDRAIKNLKEKLIEESVVVSLVCIAFLLHLRSALVAIVTIPVGVLMAFIVMNQQGLNANIMSLGGIAIAIGAMIDGAIVMIENAHKHLERDAGTKNRWQIIYEAAGEVGPALFFSLLIITISFLPVFTLQAQEGRLFSPLAFTKTYSMAAAALLSVTLVPVMMGYFVRGRILPERRNPLNLILNAIYKPVIWLVLRMKLAVILIAALVLAVTVIPLQKLGTEFMPPLNEGDLLYMPSALPGISITKAREVLQQTDKILKTFPEIHHVFGKIGRAETATDPAPLNMVETTLMLKPEDQWRPGMTMESLIEEMNAATSLPGIANVWTMPIKNRTDMLATGIKTPVGIKIAGENLGELERLGLKVESLLRQVPGTRSVYAERVGGANYLDIEIDRAESARYGLTVGDAQDAIQTAIGGMNISTTVEGLQRYPINLRYSRELRDNPFMLQRVLVSTPRGEQIPLAQIAKFSIKKGPDEIKSENARLNAWIYIDIKDIDVGTYVANAQQVLEERFKLPPGYSLAWSGQFEYMERAKARLKIVVPFTLLIIFVLLFLNFQNVTESLIVMLSLPFALVGGVWYLYYLKYELSVAVAVGFIALAGVASEIAVLVLVYIDHEYQKKMNAGGIASKKELRDVVILGTSERVRPIMMTVTAIIGGLLPIMWGHGTGSEVMKRIAAPMVGGMVSATVLTLIVVPAIYALVLERRLKKSGAFSGR